MTPAIIQAAGKLRASRRRTFEADAHLQQLAQDLGLLTHDWTDLAVERSYDSGDDGEQDYEDEAMLFEQHGYTKWVDRPHGAIKATYTIGDGLPNQQAPF